MIRWIHVTNLAPVELGGCCCGLVIVIVVKNGNREKKYQKTGDNFDCLKTKSVFGNTVDTHVHVEATTSGSYPIVHPKAV